MVRLVEELHFPWELRGGGKYFLKTEAGALVRALLSRIRRQGPFELCIERSFAPENVEISGTGVRGRTKDGASFEARHLVVALGSPACPGSGATGLGFALAQRLGRKVLAPEAALTPLRLPEDSPLLGLQGISLPAQIEVEGIDGQRHRFQDDLLFTHAGISGPCVLKASLFWKRGTPAVLDFLPGVDAQSLFADENAGRGTPAPCPHGISPRSSATLCCLRIWPSAAVPRARRPCAGTCSSASRSWPSFPGAQPASGRPKSAAATWTAQASSR